MVQNGIMSVLAIGLLCSGEVQARIIDQITTFKQQEEIVGCCFGYEEAVHNGMKGEQWFVGGKQTTREDYDVRRQDALLKELQEQQEQERKDRESQMSSRLQQRCEIAKKLVGKSLDGVKNTLILFEKPLLKPFMAWSSQSIAQQSDFDAITRDTIPAAMALIAKDQIQDTSELEGYIEKFNDLKVRLNRLYQETITKAINNADDPRVLRELLALVS